MSDAATTTEIATTPKQTDKQIDMGNRGLILRDFSDAWRFCVAVTKSGMCPKGYTGKPQDALVAIQYGAEIGLAPLQSLQSIAVIQGRPTVWGDALPGLLWGSGLLADMKEWLDGTGDARTAHCELKRVGAETPIHRTFSVADAKKAQLWEKRGKEGQPTPWVTYPERMLMWRARSWAARDGFADVLRGLQVREEVQDYREHGEPQRVESSEPPRLSLLPSKQEEPFEAPEFDDDPVMQCGTDDVATWLAEITEAAKSAQSLEALEGINGELDAEVDSGRITAEQAKAVKHIAGLTAKRLRESEKSGALFQ